MSEIDLPPDVLDLIDSAVPTMDALEILIFLARNPDRQWTESQIVNEIRPVVITAAAVKESIALFQSHGLISDKQSSSFRFDPASSQLEGAISGLANAYRERPVTLIRAVYAAAEKRRIRSFADAFKIKKD